MLKTIFILMWLGLISCGVEKTADQTMQSPTAGTVKQDRNLTVYFSPLSLHLQEIEKYKLWDTFKDIKDEDKGHWVIISHAFESYFALARAREVEHFLRHHMGFDVLGVIQGKDDGNLGEVDVTFTYYTE